MGFEPTTLCLGSKYSTTELHPPYFAREQILSEKEAEIKSGPPEVT